MAHPKIHLPKLTIEHLWLAVPFFVITVKGFLAQLPLLDFWWHLKMGEIIWTTRSIPRTDLFSFTATGKPFIVQNWIAEIFYYGVYRLGGFPLLVFFNTALLAAALLPVYLLCREATNRTRLAVLAAFLAALVFFINMRPHVFSFVLFAIFYWIVDGYRFGRRDKLWLLPVLMIIWVNTHGAFVVGLGLIALYLGSETVRRIGSPARENVLSVAQMRKLVLIFAACVAATLLNPETYKLYDYIRTVMSDPSSQLFVMEWQPPIVTDWQGILLFYGPFYLAIAAFVLASKRPNLTDFALFLAFSIFGLTATRNSIWFGMVIAPILARNLATIDFGGALKTLCSPENVSPPTAAYASPSVRASRQIHFLNVFIAGAAVMVLIFVSPWVRPGLYHTSLLEPATPVGAIDFIKEHALSGNIFHPQIYGDYLIWRLYPRQHSFFDGRVHLFGEAFVREYRLLFYDSHWEEKLIPFNVHYLLLNKERGQGESATMIGNARASKNWTVLFEDHISVLFGRKKPGTPSLSL